MSKRLPSNAAERLLCNLTELYKAATLKKRKEKKAIIKNAKVSDFSTARRRKKKKKKAALRKLEETGELLKQTVRVSYS